jgi:rhodanese-related sulfurtransferase
MEKKQKIKALNLKHRNNTLIVFCRRPSRSAEEASLLRPAYFLIKREYFS